MLIRILKNKFNKHKLRLGTNTTRIKGNKVVQQIVINPEKQRGHIQELLFYSTSHCINLRKSKIDFTEDDGEIVCILTLYNIYKYKLTKSFVSPSRWKLNGEFIYSMYGDNLNTVYKEYLRCSKVNKIMEGLDAV